MTYEIELTATALEDLEKLKRSGDKKSLIKLDKLFDELRKTPITGTGKPERLKHFSKEIYSRRINAKHRLVYQIFEDKILVLVLSMWGHYSDK